MAIYVVYQQTAETETEVEYHYGHSETEMNTRLLIDKTNETRPLKEGPDDPIATKVVGRVIVGYRQTGSWPTRGAIQS